MENAHELSGRHLVAGNWVGSDGKSFAAITAKTGEALLPEFRDAGEKEVNTAFTAAVDAFEKTRETSGEEWAKLLEAIAVGIEGRGEALIARAGLETALPEARLKGELARTTGQLRMFAGVAREGSWVNAILDTAEPDRKPLPRPDIRRMRRAIGPVVVFGASNFPFAFGTCGGDTASALAAGNPVIVKGHPGHPGTNELFAGAVSEALKQRGLPSGIFSLLQGSGSDIGSLLVRHPKAEAVGFTGSLKGGRALFDLASARDRPIPVFAEMGSINPLVVLPGALEERLDAIVDGLAQSVTMGGGQFCTKPGTVFYLAGETGDRFAQRLTEKLSEAPPATLLNAGIRDKFDQAVRSLAAVQEVEERVSGVSTGNADRGPSLLLVSSEAWRANSELREEAFGPAALLVACRDLDDLQVTLKVAAGQLTGTIHTGATDSADSIREVAAVLEQKVGRLIFNGYPTGVEVGHAMMHGGPYPATTASGTTSVGSAAIERFARAVAFQNVPDALLPPALQNANPLGLWRKVNGAVSSGPIP